MPTAATPQGVTSGVTLDSGRGPGGGLRGHLGSLAFLAPGAVWLAVMVGYPLVATVISSVLDQSGSFIGLGNYRQIFSTNEILLTFRNNVIWVVVFPFLVSFLGLVFAVLTERIRWSTAMKTIIFMPIVFSATASALTWRVIFDLDPHIGMINAAVQTVSGWVSPPGAYPVDVSAGQSIAALASTGVQPGPSGTLESKSTYSPGDVAQLGFIGISADTLNLLGAKPASVPGASSGGIAGVAWRDFSPTHPTEKGVVLPDEQGLPNLHLTLLKSDGTSAGATTTGLDGSFHFSGVSGGGYRVQVDASNFKSGYTGTFFLGTQSLTPTSRLGATAQALLSVPIVDLTMIVAYLWIWSGFAMVVIGAGLAALNREVLEAAKIDGATEWQTFRRVTMPMLQPVLIVVLVTMIINVLKIFDIIINMPPGTSQGDASTLALAMFNTGFSPNPNTGLASALAVILFLLVIPAMLFNLRRIRGG